MLQQQIILHCNSLQILSILNAQQDKAVNAATKKQLAATRAQLKNATKSATTKDNRENKHRTKQASTHLSVACTAASVQYSISPEQLTGELLT